MVGLSDIPCVGIAINRISEAIVDIAFRGSSYLFCTKNLVKDLNSQIKKVEILENEFATQVTHARNDGKIIKSHVVNWQEEIKSIKTEAAEISGQTTSSSCFRWLQFPNPVARIRRGRRAAHLAKTVTEQTNSGKEFLAIEIAHDPPTENLPHPDTTYQSFGSRQEAYKKLWDSIVNEDGSPILGIYGMPGAGKTRMMEQLWQEAMDKRILEKVTRANVGQTIDVLKLQDQLAHRLSCNLTSKDDKEARASQLQNSLKNGGKTLVILDDVWGVIPLNQIGIPFADGTFKGCKILVTSRRRDLCLKHNCIDPIEIKVLTATEAWEMFQNTVGTSTFESFKDTSLAKKVCEKCGALPLLIHVVGSALKYGTEYIWKTALYQLNNQKSEEIDGMEQHVYACVRLSFLKLAEDARICLLLCSVLFAEDADIRIKEMSDIATASGLLEPDSEIAGLVDTLKFSSLLLQGKDDETVKLHDIIRDVGRSVAVTDRKIAFLFVRCKSRWTTNADCSTRRLLHVDLEGDNVRFRDDLVCQYLHTLWLQCNNHIQNRLNSFFIGFTNLKVVVLQRLRSSEQQFSIRTLDKLRMLELVDSYPQPMITGISKLTSLEELNIPNGFRTTENGSNGISAELSTLNCLTKLTIWFSEYQSCLSNIVKNLVEFNIKANQNPNFVIPKPPVRCATVIKLIGSSAGWMPLLERVEVVDLSMVEGLPDGFTTEAFENLLELDLDLCYDMKYIASWDRRNQQLKCFTNLRNLNVDGCRGLEYLFSSGVANCLLELRKLHLYNRVQIKEIVRFDYGQETVSFSKLKELYLWYLPELTSLCNNNKVEFPQLKFLKVQKCQKLEIAIRCTIFHGFENLEEVEIRECKSLNTVFHHSSAAKPNMVFPALKTLKLFLLPKLERFLSYDNEVLEIDDSKSCILFTSSVFRSFEQLQEITVSSCDLLKEIVEDAPSSNQTTPISLLELNLVMLSNLPNLQKSGVSACYIRALSAMEVENCAISSLFTCLPSEISKISKV